MNVQKDIELQIVIKEIDMKGIVFGLTTERANRKLDKIIQNYKEYWGIEPNQIIKSRNEYKVLCANGDIWQACKLHEASRGKRANIIYIDSEINDAILEQIAYHCATAEPYSAVRYY